MDKGFIPPWREIAPRREWPVRRSYTAMDLYRACEHRRYEEMQYPVGTDRIRNDLTRLKHLAANIEDELASRVEDLERDLQQADNNIRNLEQELESRE